VCQQNARWILAAAILYIWQIKTVIEIENEIPAEVDKASSTTE